MYCGRECKCVTLQPKFAFVFYGYFGIRKEGSGRFHKIMEQRVQQGDDMQFPAVFRFLSAHPTASAIS